MSMSLGVSINLESQSIEGNYSIIRLTARASWNGPHYNHYPPGYSDTARGTVTVNGSSYSFSSTFNSGRTYSGSTQIYTNTFRIYHNGDGTKVFNYSVDFNTHISVGTLHYSNNYRLPTIARTAPFNINKSTYNIGETISINISPPSSGDYVFDVWLNYGNNWTWILQKTRGTSISYTIPDSLLASCPYDTSMSGFVSIDTFYNGNKIGSTSRKPIKILVPDSIKPKIHHVTIEDAFPSLSAAMGDFVRGESRLKISYSIDLPKGVSLRSRTVEVEGKTYSGDDILTDVLKTSNPRVTIKAVDTRGRIDTYQTSLSATSYERITSTSINVKRTSDNRISYSFKMKKHTPSTVPATYQVYYYPVGQVSKKKVIDSGNFPSDGEVIDTPSGVTLATDTSYVVELSVSEYVNGRSNAPKTYVIGGTVLQTSVKTIMEVARDCNTIQFFHPITREESIRSLVRNSSISSFRALESEYHASEKEIRIDDTVVISSSGAIVFTDSQGLPVATMSVKNKNLEIRGLGGNEVKIIK